MPTIHKKLSLKKTKSTIPIYLKSCKKSLSPHETSLKYLPSIQKKDLSPQPHLPAIHKKLSLKSPSPHETSLKYLQSYPSLLHAEIGVSSTQFTLPEAFGTPPPPSLLHAGIWDKCPILTSLELKKLPPSFFSSAEIWDKCPISTSPGG